MGFFANELSYLEVLKTLFYLETGRKMVIWCLLIGGVQKVKRSTIPDETRDPLICNKKTKNP